VLLRRDVKVSSATILLLEFLNGRALFLDTFKNTFRNEKWPVDVVSLLRLSHV